MRMFVPFFGTCGEVVEVTGYRRDTNGLPVVDVKIRIHNGATFNLGSFPMVDFHSDRWEGRA